MITDDFLKLFSTCPVCQERLSWDPWAIFCPTHCLSASLNFNDPTKVFSITLYYDTPHSDKYANYVLTSETLFLWDQECEVANQSLHIPKETLIDLFKTPPTLIKYLLLQ